MAALAKKIKFTYILVPEDEGKDLQELVCEYTSETIVPCLTNACKKHFQKAKKVNESKLSSDTYEDGDIQQRDSYDDCWEYETKFVSNISHEKYTIQIKLLTTLHFQPFCCYGLCLYLFSAFY